MKFYDVTFFCDNEESKALVSIDIDKEPTKTRYPATISINSKGFSYSSSDIRIHMDLIQLHEFINSTITAYDKALAEAKDGI